MHPKLTIIFILIFVLSTCFVLNTKTAQEQRLKCQLKQDWIHAALGWGYVFHKEELSYMLVEGADINTFLLRGVTEFMVNCFKNPELVLQQLENNSVSLKDINQQNSLGITPLMIAAKYNDLLLLPLILNGADINLVDRVGNSFIDYFFEEYDLDD